MALRRKIVFQPDICEWLRTQTLQLTTIRKQRKVLDTGLLGAIKEFFPDKGESKNSSVTSEEKPTSTLNTGLEQYYESEELIKRMKWKRVTWEEDADYQGFSRRILNNETVFKNVPAFSFLSIHVIKDPLTSSLVNIKIGEKVVNPGDITSLFLKERDVRTVDQYKPSTGSIRLSPFSVDWISGSVKMLDTASPQEILTFLTTAAKRIQSVQIKMEKQQEKIIQNVNLVKSRIGASVVFNESNTTYWDDPKRKTDSNYLNPDELDLFLSNLLKAAFLYKWFLNGTEIKVLPAGSHYYCDTKKNEVGIPVNFFEFNWLNVHSRFQSLENLFNKFRRFWWFWFIVGLVVVGDIDII